LVLKILLILRRTDYNSTPIISIIRNLTADLLSDYLTSLVK